MIHPKTTINCAGKLLDLSRPVVMGILNINDDSFYRGSRVTGIEKILETAGQMLAEGAAILDIGGMSSRPGAVVIDADEELERVLPAIETIHREFPDAILSIDTIRSKIAREAVAAGASIVNDISAGKFDADLYPTLAELQVPYVLMHMQKRPENMQEAPVYENVVQEILDFLIREVDALRQLGVKDIVIDPGFGFGKSVEHNYEILRSLHVFQMLDVPILAGISRKSMISKPLGVNSEHALNGTTALHMIALQQGARILRVHDVAPAMEVIKLWELLKG
ncbi:dihydropteroate synthase [Flavilitoribacter nigricans]|uniref:dihydropteroate synthase n=1 Tax=Flavilitoribacter nigricans (strain ATCC 23147 / DSM 23189 / NBRC 102662 / NCIMB 1420 / SS-2) TaxID=1122177 RepID=A0A2D0N3I0_FLAN2|nr:dihydropteroate synthase [Flavilitoribacter nigricans]PHN02936.1 dihydropteroate synthase [Flavilitoribacter nigricans DSM 23189 = NBRC 102662]